RSFSVMENTIFSVMPTGEKTFVSVVETFATDSVSHLLYVEDGLVKSSAVSGLGYFAKRGDANDYALTVSDYDLCYNYTKGEEEFGMYTGHSWKEYYFYYDRKTEDFVEYVGESATREDLEKACGFDLAKAIEDEGYVVEAILKRENGIYNVNYSKTEDEGDSVFIEYRNACFDAVSGTFLHTGSKDGWKDSGFGGIYQPSVLEYISAGF
ncbi:MAG: hypothetical protein K6B75_06500, partial [Lachnospiraceae bacterium]|nr:hypothetical protein [Lachnospiraceae bacterium]